MGTTPIYAWSYPEGSDDPAVPLYIKGLAEDIEATMDGLDDRLDVVEPRPRGLVSYAHRDSLSDASTGAVVPVLSVASFAVVSGRAYRVRVSTAPRSTVVDDRIVTEIRFTTNGTAPTNASPVMPEGTHYMSAIPGGNSDSIMFEALYKPATSHNLRMILCVTRGAGTGSVRLYADASALTTVQTTDEGLALANSGTPLP